MRVGSGVTAAIWSTDSVTSVNGGYVRTPPTSCEWEYSILRSGSNGCSGGASFLRVISVLPETGESIVRTWQGNGSSGGEGWYPGGSAGSPPFGRFAEQAAAPAGVPLALPTLKRRPSALQIVSLERGPGPRARKVAGRVQVLPPPSVARTFPCPFAPVSIGSTRNPTEDAPGSKESTVSFTLDDPSCS